MSRSRLDREAKDWLLTQWPNSTKMWSPAHSRVWWLRAQPPGQGGGTQAPRLTAPGSGAFSNQPDGLWFTLGIPRGDKATEGAYADCVVVEVCGSDQNLSDKRARYAARTTSLMLDLRQKWLDREVVVPGKGGPRRQRRELLGGQLPPSGRVLLPVRYLRVLYALPDTRSLYERARDNLVMEAHEFICPARMLGQYNLQQMQEFLKRIAPQRQFMT